MVSFGKVKAPSVGNARGIPPPKGFEESLFAGALGFLRLYGFIVVPLCELKHSVFGWLVGGLGCSNGGMG